MSSPPPEQPPAGYGRVTIPARLPWPGNAEFVVYLLVEIMFAIVWGASAFVTGRTFVWVSAVVTAAYLLSRGIAKASRVLEQ